MRILPVPDTLPAAFIREYVGVGGLSLLVRFRWSTRMGLWCMDVQAGDGDPVVHGRRITTEVPLLDRQVHEPPITGDVFAFRRGSGDEPPGREELGDSVFLAHLNESEYNEL